MGYKTTRRQIKKFKELREKARNIRRVVQWQNGMLMVFDNNGEQVPEFQGVAIEKIPVLREFGYTGLIEGGVWQ